MDTHLWRGASVPYSSDTLTGYQTPLFPFSFCIFNYYLHKYNILNFNLAPIINSSTLEQVVSSGKLSITPLRLCASSCLHRVSCPLCMGCLNAGRLEYLNIPGGGHGTMRKGLHNTRLCMYHFFGASAPL